MHRAGGLCPFRGGLADVCGPCQSCGPWWGSSLEWVWLWAWCWAAWSRWEPCRALELEPPQLIHTEEQRGFPRGYAITSHGRVYAHTQTHHSLPVPGSSQLLTHHTHVLTPAPDTYIHRHTQYTKLTCTYRTQNPIPHSRGFMYTGR